VESMPSVGLRCGHPIMLAQAYTDEQRMRETITCWSPRLTRHWEGQSILEPVPRSAHEARREAAMEAKDYAGALQDFRPP